MTTKTIEIFRLLSPGEKLYSFPPRMSEIVFWILSGIFISSDIHIIMSALKTSSKENISYHAQVCERLITTDQFLLGDLLWEFSDPV